MAEAGGDGLRAVMNARSVGKVQRKEECGRIAVLLLRVCGDCFMNWIMLTWC